MNRCLSDFVGRSEGVQLPTLLTNLPLPGQNQEGPSYIGHDHYNMAHTGMVSPASRDVMQASNFASSPGGSNIVSLSSPTPTSATREPHISGLDGFRESIFATGVSEQTAELLNSHAWRKGTNCAYKSAWSQWSSWCIQRKIDPFCSTVAAVADYLTELLNKGRCYRTINNHRSAISAFHKPIDACKVGQHELVSKVMNACSNVKPPQPRYVVMWDVDMVLNHICSLGANNTLSDKQLTHQLSMLLALASAGRSSDLRALDLNYMTVHDDKTVFVLGKWCAQRPICAPAPGFSRFSAPEISSKSAQLCSLRYFRLELSF
jgi:hypothetical protein